MARRKNSPTWFHCTDAGGAEKIATRGFRWRPSRQIFREFFDIYLEMLDSPAWRKRIDEEAGDTYFSTGPSAIPKSAVEMLEHAWYADYGDGTAIWVAEEPRYWYGGACFAVDLPEAKIVYQGDAAGTCLWVPWKSIPVDRFVGVAGAWPLP